jgi:glucosylceramidase
MFLLAALLKQLSLLEKLLYKISNMKFLFRILFVIIVITCFVSCGKGSGGGQSPTPTPVPTPTPTPTPVVSEVAFWLTKSDGSVLLAKQNVALNFSTASSQSSTITVDSTIKYQTMDGFGYALTGGSAQLINGMSATNHNTLLKELFSTDSNAIGISYIRISIGASDLSSSFFTYDEMPSGQTDLNLTNFNFDIDRLQLVPLLKEIIAINPSIKILGSPWTAPSWMKTNKSGYGGKLDPVYYNVYADYLIKYIKAMKAEGITIDAITPQNEPLNAFNNPSMEMTAIEQTDFIKNNIGTKFRAANITTKIIIYDHNADHPDYPLTVLSDATASQYVDGSAFHLYAGTISALSTVHNAYPNKNIYFTEQYTSSTGLFSGDLAWHFRNLIIGAPRNWSRNVIEWNLANDPNYNPHLTGGCTDCKGALTLNGDNITRNVSYYIIAHASKFVPAGSVRVESNTTSNLQNVAYVTPAGKKVLIVLNDSIASQAFNISFNGKIVTVTLDAGSVGTFTW